VLVAAATDPEDPDADALDDAAPKHLVCSLTQVSIICSTAMSQARLFFGLLVTVCWLTVSQHH
jgi:hypothetical protein